MTPAVAADAPKRVRSPLPRSVARLHDRVGTAGMVAAGFLLTVSLLAVLAPVVAPYGPNAADLLHPSAGPSSSHLLGTDELGRDLLSRLFWGARSGLLGPLIVIAIATAVAIPLAAIAGWLGGAVDLIVGRVLDLLFAFPGLLLAILVVSLYGPGLLPCAVALSLSYMPWIARVARSGIVRERNKAYIAAVDVQGLSGFAICARHLIPNISSIIWSQATISFGYALIDLAALSFLGLNVQPPTADWGVMVNNEAALLQGHPLQVFYPCLLIVLCVTAVTYLGNRLADDVDGRTP
jgi:peptide/nickel transport system permease protein